mmetsp:Transcript_1870/g.4158  ORF Transcript_1870/g.4158 Transcript_1870/m.4158 type:complete len:210 (+) Transcript_1870:644-1273(+)
MGCPCWPPCCICWSCASWANCWACWSGVGPSPCLPSSPACWPCALAAAARAAAAAAGSVGAPSLPSSPCCAYTMAMALAVDCAWAMFWMYCEARCDWAICACCICTSLVMSTGSCGNPAGVVLPDCSCALDMASAAARAASERRRESGVLRERICAWPLPFGFLRERSSAFQRILTAFSVRPGSICAIWAHLLPDLFCMSIMILSSSGV